MLVGCAHLSRLRCRRQVESEAGTKRRPIRRLRIVEMLIPHRVERTVWAVAAIVALVGGLIVVGWVLNLTVIPSGVAGAPRVKANAGLCLLFSGAGLLLAMTRRLVVLARALAVVVVLIGSVSLIESALMFNVGIDQLLFRDPAPLNPGRMAPNTALAFVLCGLALLLVRRPRTDRLAEALGVLGSTIGWLALIGFAAGLSELVQVGTFVKMALPTAICVLLLGAALMFAAPGGRLRAMLASPGPAGPLVRRLLASVVVVPPVVGGVLRLGQSAGVLDEGEVILLIVATVALSLLTVALSFAGSLDRADIGRRRAELELRESERHHREVVEASIDAFIAIDSTGLITAWNPAAETLFGWPAADALGRTVAELIVPEHLRNRHQTGLERLAAGGESSVVGRRIELPALRRDGQQVPVELSISITHDHGAPGFHAFVHDVSERAAARHAVEEERGQLDDAQAIAHVGSWSWEPTTDRTRWSAEMYRIFDRDPGQGPAAGEAFFEYLHLEDQTRIATGYAAAFGRGDGFELDYRIVLRDGEIRYLHGIGRREGDGRYVGTVQDLSASRRIEAALRDAEESFRGAFEHTPLGAVLTAPDGTWLRVNRSFGEILGYSESELLALSFKDIAYADDVVARAKDIERLVSGEIREHRAQKRCLHKDGRLVWVDVWTSLIRDGAGDPLRFISQIEDITERKRIAATLHAAQVQQAEISQRLELILANLHGSAVVLYDRELRLRFCEGPLFANADLSQMLGQALPDFVTAEMFALLGPGVHGALSGEPSSTVLDADESGRTLAVHFAPYQRTDGTIDGALVHWQDVSAVRHANRERDQALELFEVAFENAPIGMALLDLEGRFTQVNAALCEMLGYPPAELVGMRVLSLTHPDDVDSDREGLDQMRAGQRASYSSEKRYVHASGHPLYCAQQATLITTEDGRPQHLLSQIQDITDRKRNEQQLEYLADHDALTGLLNRRAFARDLGSHADRVSRYGAEGTILMVDLDQFKFVNDTLGHQAGDELIVRVADLLSERLRDTDVLARLGGDEFAVLLPKAGPSAAKLVANSILETLRSEAIRIAGTERKVTASIGIASFEDAPALSGEDVMINADLAMYDAKEAGRNRLAAFSTDRYTQARMKGRITWAQRITSALETDGFALLAQPIINLATGHTSQYELLLRMKDEHGDLIPPSVFLYIAERLDLIQDIDAWVVSNGIKTLAELDPSHDISLEINLSGRSIGDQKLLEHIDTELRNTRVDPERIIFEITETAALTSVTKARAFGEHLSEIGCRFALDDFGAGFGSFYYLKHLVFDYLKIDGEFVHDCRSNPTDELVIKAIVDIARGMGKQTIAEFVGDDETVRLLTRLGVDYGQGYHLGMPAGLHQQLAAQKALPTSASSP